MPELIHQTIDSPIGKLLLAADAQALRVAGFVAAPMSREPEPGWKEGDGAILREARRELALYFEGRLRAFTCPVAPIGTAFQQDVWRALRRIPHAETASYGELAARMGRPGSARAVGAACGRNPIAILIPCHRVVGRSGALTGFAGGLEVKRSLLRLEGGAFCDSRPASLLPEDVLRWGSSSQNEAHH